MQEALVSEATEPALKPVTVGLITRTNEGEDTVYRVVPHAPGGHTLHLVWSWILCLLGVGNTYMTSTR
jgi:hypothetical protein